jgi:hypothetical protein
MQSAVTPPSVETRWPNLRFVSIGGLEYKVQMAEPKQLREAARRIESGEPLGPLAWPIAEFLRKCAGTRGALNKINHPLRRTPRKIQGLARAAHYSIRLEILGPKRKKDARQEVATIWGGISQATIRDDHDDFGDEAQRLIEFMAHQTSARLDRRKFLKAFDADLRAEAARVPRTPRKKQSKPARKK